MQECRYRSLGHHAEIYEDSNKSPHISRMKEANANVQVIMQKYTKIVIIHCVYPE